MDPQAQILHRLQQIQDDRPAQWGWTWTALQAEAVLLAELPEKDAADLLQQGRKNWPTATRLLLTAVANTPGLPPLVASAVLRCIMEVNIDADFGEFAAEVIKAALPVLTPAMKLAALCQYPRLQPGPLGGPVVAPAPEMWPHDRNFPALETIEGRQARLQYLGYPTTDPPGIWGAHSEAAMIQYQIDSAAPHLGTWDAQTAEMLDREAIGKMCIHRDDPSELFQTIKEESHVQPAAGHLRPL